MPIRPARLVPLLLSSAAFAQTSRPVTQPTTVPTPVTEKDVISGVVRVEFAQRPTTGPTTGTTTSPPATTAATAPPATRPAVDRVRLRLAVSTVTEFAGDVTIAPGGPARYALDVSVLNPANHGQKKRIGRWTGDVPAASDEAVSDFSADPPDGRRMRLTIDPAGKAVGYTEPLAGQIIDTARLPAAPAARAYARVIDGRRIGYDLPRITTTYFRDLALPRGPAPMYPGGLVSGRLDADADTGSLITDGLRFAYTIDGVKMVDYVVGTIRRKTDDDYAATGRGRYEFNLRFNEPKAKLRRNPTTHGTTTRPNETALFFTDPGTAASLTGRIDFVDAFSPDAHAVVGRTMTYHLNANNLTRQQVMNFFKLWLTCLGPTAVGNNF